MPGKGQRPEEAPASDNDGRGTRGQSSPERTKRGREQAAGPEFLQSLRREVAPPPPSNPVQELYMAQGAKLPAQRHTICGLGPAPTPPGPDDWPNPHAQRSVKQHQGQAEPWRHARAQIQKKRTLLRSPMEDPLPGSTRTSHSDYRSPEDRRIHGAASTRRSSKTGKAGPPRGKEGSPGHNGKSEKRIPPHTEKWTSNRRFVTESPVINEAP